jgi:AcrR family transcriptional regulator
MDHTADRLLEAAEALLFERGPEGLTLREVARRVGVTPMAVYRHFDGLDALKSALRERAGKALFHALAESLGEPDARSRLEATARAYVRFALDKPAYFRLLFTGGPPPEEAARAVEVRRNASAARFMVDRVREAMDAGVLPRDDPEARTIDLWALLHGLVTLQQEGKLRLEPSKFEQHLNSTLRWILR